MFSALTSADWSQTAGRQVTGRLSYGVLSTMVVRVETFATDRIRAISPSRADGVATRTLRM
jgi:hypothetical protein